VRTSILLLSLLGLSGLLTACPEPIPDDDDSAAGDDDDSSPGDDDDATPPDSEACETVLDLCPDGCTLDIDVELHRVFGTVSWAGAPIPGGPGNTFDLVFVDPETGQEHAVPFGGQTADVGSIGSRMIVGTWDVFFEWTGNTAQGGADFFDVIQGRIPVAEAYSIPNDEDLVIAIEPQRVGGALQWLGADIPGNSSNELDFVFRPSDGGDELRVTRAAWAGPLSTYDIPMLPGNYDVEIEWRNTADPSDVSWPDPLFGRIPVANSLPVTAASPVTLDITPDLPRVTGAFSWDGAPIPQSDGNEIEIIFLDEDGQQRWVRRWAGPADIASFDVPMVPGTYTVFVNWTGAADPADSAWPDPIWGWIRVAEDVEVTGAGGTVDLSAEPARVTGTYRWDGAPAPQSVFNQLAFSFSDVGGDRLEVHRDALNGPLGSFDLPMVPGTYTLIVYWIQALPEDDADFPDPLYEDIVLRKGIEIVDGTNQVDIEIDPYRLSGALTWDRMPIPEGEQNQFELILYSQDGRNHVLRSARDGAVSTYDMPVLPGDYEVGFRWLETAGPDSPSFPDPVFGEHHAGSVTVGDGDATLDIAPDPVRLGGSFTWDAGPVPASPENWGVIRFEAMDEPFGWDAPSAEWGAWDGELSAYDVNAPQGLWRVQLEWFSSASRDDAGWPDPVWRPITLVECAWIH